MASTQSHNKADNNWALDGIRLDVGTLLLHALRSAGVREIFGIPGDFVLPFFKVIEESGILPFYTLSHEPSVGFAADGAARCSCRPSVAVVTYGAGALNMVNPIAAAYAEKVPVIVVSGGPGVEEQHTELLLHHQAKRLDSQFQIYKEVTCSQTRLTNPDTAPAELSRVISRCITNSRPVYIELPRDQVTSRCPGPMPLDLQRQCDVHALDTCVDELIEVIRMATSPVLMVGVEIRRLGIEEQVAKLARLLGIPVVTSFMGRGLLAGRDVPVMGSYLGVAGNPQVSQLVEDADGLFLLGVILSDTNLGTSKRKLNLKTCIRAQDGCVSLDYHNYPDIPLSFLVDGLIKKLQDFQSFRPLVQSSVMPHYCPHGLLADDELLTPDDVATGINDLIEHSGSVQVVADVGDCLFVAMDIEDTALAAPGYYASMGFAIPASLGIQVATGKRPLVLVGDGAFQMTGWELGNCSRYSWDPIVVVLNNCGWEMLRAFQPESRFNDLDSWRFAELAKPLGGHGVRVTTRREFQVALQNAHQRRGQFQLIEVMIPRGKISRTMGQYVAGIKRKK